MRAAVAWLVVGISAAAAAAGGPLSFAWERAVVSGGAGPNRLEVDLPLLAGARPLRYAEDRTGAPLETFLGGLDDLRFYDREGNEIGYLLFAPDRPHARWEAGEVRPVPESGATSGFEVTLKTAQLVDRLGLKGIAPPYLKRLTVEGSADGEEWTALAAGAVVYDLPDERLTRTEVDLEPGAYRVLRVTWDDRSTARVPLPAAAAARVVSMKEPEPVLIPLEIAAEESEPGKSRFRLKLPGGALPVNAIQVDIRERTLMRSAVIREPRLIGTQVSWEVIGASELRKTERGGVTVGDVRVPIRRPRGAELELVVENGAAPPLQITGARAELAPLPIIYLETGDRALTARYGNRSLGAPSYELEATRPLVDPSRAFEAKWGQPKASEESIAAGDSIRPLGAMVDTREFRYRRNIPAEEQGLNALLLDAAVLAHSTLADLRIVDDEGRQIPYVLEKRDDPLVVELDLGKREEPAPGESLYRINLPFDTLPSETRVVLRTNERVFRRNVIVERDRSESQKGKGSVLATAEWRHDDPETEPQPLVLRVPMHGLSHFSIRINEGDNAPLVLLPPRILLPSYRLRFYYPRGSQLALYYGNPRIRAPQYDLELLSARLFSMPAHEVRASEELEASASKEPAARRFFFASLAAVAVILLILLARLLRLHDDRVEMTDDS